VSDERRSMFPFLRLRRLRRPGIRDLVRETRLSPADFIYPLFADATADEGRDVPSMPGVRRLPVDALVEEAAAAREDGVRAVLLFGIPEHKDERGTSSWDEEGIVQRSVRALRESVPDLVVITDVCLCEYTSHGHCGVVEDGRVLNDPTLHLLARQAVSHARAGAQVVAPSDMMDGRVRAIRDALDAEGLADTAILSYAAKYASSFYGPFRDAADSSPSFGDRRGYQMDPANGDEALREVRLDVEEGADMVMVKPALGYLDIVHRVKEAFGLPTVAYSVSGEFAMIRAAAERGWIDADAAVWEAAVATRRAGADLVVTYAARELARRARDGEAGGAP